LFYIPPKHQKSQKENLCGGEDQHHHRTSLEEDQTMPPEFNPIPPKPVDRYGIEYDDELINEYAIAEYITQTSAQDVDEDLIIEKYRDCRALLRLIPIEKIRPGDLRSNLPSETKEEQYAKQSVKTLPPIFLDGGAVRDGNHRYRVWTRRGLTHFWCYVVQPLEKSS